ncbi:hypothetical protein HK096_000443, partial [Nowakowskiella sp. JEL0078]
MSNTTEHNDDRISSKISTFRRNTYVREKSHDDLREPDVTIDVSELQIIPQKRPDDRQNSISSITSQEFNKLNLDTTFKKGKYSKTDILVSPNLVTPNRTLSRPERAFAKKPFFTPDKGEITSWKLFSWIVTFWAPGVFLRKFKKMIDPAVQQAWREKISLCFLFAIACASLGFLTYGLQKTICPAETLLGLDDIENNSGYVIIRGAVYNLSSTVFANYHNSLSAFTTQSKIDFNSFKGKDLSTLFPSTSEVCKE